MPFLQLTLSIGAADPAPIEDALLTAGATSITLQDAGDDPVLEPAPGTTPLWPSVQIKALFDDSIDPQAVLSALRAELSQPLPDAHFETVADRAWEREWLKDFHPMQFGRRLWICPGGQRPDGAGPGNRDIADTTLHSTDATGAISRFPGPAPSPAAPSLPPSFCFIELDPGLAFGTGTHPTTALCLEWLDGAQLEQQRVLDYGCGSGVLAIAALKLGAASAVAVDIDPQALLATRDNAIRNHVEERLRVQPADSPIDAPVDVLLANILAEPLETLAPTFADLVAPGGRLVLSGILRSQAAAVATRYAPWFDIGPAILRDDWARLDGVRRTTVRAC
jgi:ribosomal protein L11 methyltransferase